MKFSNVYFSVLFVFAFGCQNSENIVEESPVFSENIPKGNSQNPLVDSTPLPSNSEGYEEVDCQNVAAYNLEQQKIFEEIKDCALRVGEYPSSNVTLGQFIDGTVVPELNYEVLGQLLGEPRNPLFAVKLKSQCSLSNRKLYGDEWYPTSRVSVPTTYVYPQTNLHLKARLVKDAQDCLNFVRTSDKILKIFKRGSLIYQIDLGKNHGVVNGQAVHSYPIAHQLNGKNWVVKGNKDLSSCSSNPNVLEITLFSEQQANNGTARVDFGLSTVLRMVKPGVKLGAGYFNKAFGAESYCQSLKRL
jgi:hypothetical protein